MSEFIYVIQCPESKLIKIGRTTNSDPYERISSLQTANPFTLEVVKIVVGPDGLEPKIHNQFKSFRFRGEWFKAECLEMLLDALKKYPEFDKNTEQISRQPKVKLEKTINAQSVERHNWMLGDMIRPLRILKFRKNIWRVMCIDYRWSDRNFCCESQYRVSTIERLKRYLDQCSGCLAEHDIWLAGCLTSVFFSNIDDARAFVKVLQALTKNDFIDTSLSPAIMPTLKGEEIEFDKETLKEYENNQYINREFTIGAWVK